MGVLVNMHIAEYIRGLPSESKPEVYWLLNSTENCLRVSQGRWQASLAIALTIHLSEAKRTVMSSTARHFLPSSEFLPSSSSFHGEAS